MGVCQSVCDHSPERQRSVEIDKAIKEDYHKSRHECKVLLLGSGESGKSTILKQMKIINQNGYSTAELRHWRIIILRNLVDSAKRVDQALDQFGERYACKKATMLARQRIRNHIEPADPTNTLSPDMIKAIDVLWKDPAVQLLLEEKGDDFYLIDWSLYFFKEMDRICKPDYLPEVQDVLRARQKTTGITEIQFEIDGLQIRMVDVGGQRSERRKWIHCFEAVTSVIFCVALSEYDQVLLEESHQNRMLESLTLFESIINSRWFLQASIMLFLNKADIFKRKIDHIPLKDYFPDYEGGNDPSNAIKYILWRFMQTNHNNLSIYPHLTQATDTENIRYVFAVVKDTLLQAALRNSGML